MIPKWKAGFFCIFPYSSSIFLVLFITIKGDDPKQKILPALVVANELKLPSDSETVITSGNTSQMVTKTTTTTPSMGSVEEILSRRRRYLVFPDGSSIQMGIYLLWKMVFL